MRAFLFTEGVAGVIAAVASYIWGYLDGRAEIRACWEKTLRELRDFD
ncbi:MAG TPA: hypothetical protein VIM56_04315 [Rhizomicrobium sp.]